MQPRKLGVTGGLNFGISRSAEERAGDVAAARWEILGSG